MYGSWLAIFAWVVGIFASLGALYGLIKIYITYYQFYKGRNETKANMVKDMLINSATEILLFLGIIGCIIFVIFYGVEPAEIYLAPQ